MIDESTDLRAFHGLCRLSGKDIFWANIGWEKQHWDLPLGHHAYLVMVEGPEISWIQKQAARVKAPVFVLGLPNDYDIKIANTKYLPWVEWHYQTRSMIDQYPWPGKTSCKYIASALTSRVTQSKIWALVALCRTLGEQDRLISLGNNIENKNVHDWQAVGHVSLDGLTLEFVQDYLGKSFQVDTFDHREQTIHLNHDYTGRAYVDCVFNINNESWHYSYHQTSEKSWCWPGPFLTEKTMKVLCSETALISNGQFDTYRTLKSLGFTFDYGLDLSYDDDPANFDRAQGMVSVIKELSKNSADQWFDITANSRKHNRQHIISGNFYDVCEQQNQQTVNEILGCL